MLDAEERFLMTRELERLRQQAAALKNLQMTTPITAIDEQIDLLELVLKEY
ncbi:MULTISPECIES: hypothetical protein [unclassified Geomicrobium]|uniref:hypothetical protein n=1 Tax=unclassified Geomicrobium TaxID=2628951 RepID=UPI00045ECE4F|nr:MULTISPECIES: hypothetical protein [unclassified Geomicrobium]GAJ98372.1 hypothetical protein JCM19055_1295 [Geomicrobium sp. JCM 19055]GAK07603.1 hypothetical protein JCM19038_1342 [Geomicrobium sp. JCM 19038]